MYIRRTLRRTNILIKQPNHIAYISQQVSLTHHPSTREYEEQLTCIPIIANRIIRLHTPSIRQSIRTILRRTTKVQSTLPHNLSHMRVLFEICHVRIRLAVLVVEVCNFGIVPEIGDAA